MPRIRHLAAAVSTALLFSATASAADFNKVVAFGDSLSDSGNVALLSGFPGPARFTTNPGTTAIENIAMAYGYTLTPSLAGGTDFAFGGAQVSVNDPVPSTTAQITGYLAANGGRADPKTLYSVWIGANDLLGAAAAPSQAAALQTAVIAATQEVGNIKALQDAGAKTIVVFNIPDIGKTPAAMAGGAAAAAGASTLALAYNGTLNGGIATLGKGIVPIDTYSLLNEIIAQPGKYGFTNVTTPACTTASSLTCTPATLVAPDAGKNYLFADGIHPTNAAHALLGQYAVSIISAPEKISLLGEAPLASNAAHVRTLRDQMLADNFGSDSRVFAAVDYGKQKYEGSSSSPKTDSDNINLTVGADARIGENVSAGLALGIAQSDADFAGNSGGYRMQDLAASGYVMYHQGGGYVGAYGTFGQLSFNDIERKFDLGAARRIESGDTSGSHLGGALTGGWWFGSSSIKTGPFVNVEWQNIKIDPYNEDGKDSSSMWFGRQQRKSLVSTVGWRLQGNWTVHELALRPYAEVAFNRDSKADPRDIEAGLSSMNGTFILQGFNPDKTWGTADLGLMAQLSENVVSWLGYSGRFSDDSQKYNSVNLGMKIGF
jgi:outer membrane lipase/esterase